MHSTNANRKLFLTDIALTLLTLIGSTYLYTSGTISLPYATFIAGLYILAKITGYIILPYEKFDIFLTNLITTSAATPLSGFEIFKTTLVALLFLGFLFVDPAFWILESILVVMMRVWGKKYCDGELKCLSKV